MVMHEPNKVSNVRGVFIVSDLESGCSTASGHNSSTLRFVLGQDTFFRCLSSTRYLYTNPFHGIFPFTLGPSRLSVRDLIYANSA